MLHPKGLALQFILHRRLKPIKVLLRLISLLAQLQVTIQPGLVHLYVIGMLHINALGELLHQFVVLFGTRWLHVI